jgi:hypothetical protein
VGTEKHVSRQRSQNAILRFDCRTLFSSKEWGAPVGIHTKDTEGDLTADMYMRICLSDRLMGSQLNSEVDMVFSPLFHTWRWFVEDTYCVGEMQKIRMNRRCKQ